MFFAGHDGPNDERIALIRELLPQIESKVRLGVFGTCGRPAISGANYEQALLSSRMALSLNRVEGWKWYSSDRLAHLMGRGILTFISAKSGYDAFFRPDEEAVFFTDAADLAEKGVRSRSGPAYRVRRSRALSCAFQRRESVAVHCGDNIRRTEFGIL